MSVLVYGVLALSWCAVLLVAGVYFPVIALFGRDDPATTTAQYILVLAIPPGVVVLMGAACWWAHRMWRSDRWRLVGLALAIGLGLVAWRAVRFLPH